MAVSLDYYDGFREWIKIHCLCWFIDVIRFHFSIWWDARDPWTAVFSFKSLASLLFNALRLLHPTIVIKQMVFHWRFSREKGGKRTCFKWLFHCSRWRRSNSSSSPTAVCGNKTHHASCCDDKTCSPLLSHFLFHLPYLWPVRKETMLTEEEHFHSAAAAERFLTVKWRH